MDRHSRFVLGYHGCEPATAEALIRGDLHVAAWKPSRNIYDWLGEGIYFWEDAPVRALEWNPAGGIVGALIQLGTCLDLTDVNYAGMLANTYENVRAKLQRENKKLPKNSGKRHELDCLIIDHLVQSIERREKIKYHTVRGAFLEGDPVFPGSGILRETHIQIAVRDSAAILGIFKPNLRDDK